MDQAPRHHLPADLARHPAQADPPRRPGAGRAGSTNPDKDVARWDLLLSPNPASTERLRHAFRFGGPVRETGYPRNDVLSRPTRDDVRARVRAELGIADGTTAVLYAPTWRDDLVFDTPATGTSRSRSTSTPSPSGSATDHVLLLPGCTAWWPAGSPIPPGAPVVDVSDRAESAELYLAADMLVTDYSSAMFDFAVTGKPMVFYTYDLEHYRDDVRGFYFDLAEVAPGPLVRTSEELIEAIADRDVAASELADRYARFRRHLLLARRRARDRPRARPALPARRPRRTIHHGKGMNVRTTDRALTSSPRDLARTAAPRHMHRHLHPPVQAVILAAGMGTRLGRTTPKPLTPLHDGRTIQRRQLDALREAFGDDTDITVVVGFSSDLLMAASPDVRFAYNPHYASTNTSKSLLARPVELPRRRRALDERRRRLRPRRARARHELGPGRRELHLRRHRDRRRRGDQVHPRRRRLHPGAVQDRRRRPRRGRGHQLRVQPRQGRP